MPAARGEILHIESDANALGKSGAISSELRRGAAQHISNYHLSLLVGFTLNVEISQLSFWQL